MNTKKVLGYGLFVVIIALAFTACKDDPEPAHTHTWGAWKTTPATETENGTETRVCKTDQSHKETKFSGEYATGMAGLAYTLLTTGDYANTYEVSRGTFDGTALHIPAYHREPTDVDYIPVTRISNFGYSNPNTTLTTVTFAAENQLKIIGNDAFCYCTSIASIIIPDSVTAIGDSVTSTGGGYAFSNCTSLTSIIIPASVTTIGFATFGNCTSLTSIVIPTSVTSIGMSAFWGCTSCTSITIPANVMFIGIGAFNSWTDTQTINVPFANADATPAGWHNNWKGPNCNAVIKYWNGTTWE